jgi:hypothetical protein
MKTHPSPRLSLLLALALGLPLLCPVASAQRGISIPVPVPGSRNRAFETRNTGNSTESKIGPEHKKTKVVTVQYVAVTPVRSWMNNKGDTMKARVLAFSAPEKGESGPVEVIRGGKIRFLLFNTKKPILYPVANLSEADQEYVRGIAKAAQRGTRPAPEARREAKDNPADPASEPAASPQSQKR